VGIRRMMQRIKRTGMSGELYELYGETGLVTCIKPKRLQWAGQVQRMEGTRIPKKVLKAKFGGVR
jgi:hypothetical protein